MCTGGPGAPSSGRLRQAHSAAGRRQEPGAESISPSGSWPGQWLPPHVPHAPHSLTTHSAQTTPPALLMILERSFSKGCFPSLLGSTCVPLGEGVSQSLPGALSVTLLPLSMSNTFTVL